MKILKFNYKNYYIYISNLVIIINFMNNKPVKGRKITSYSDSLKIQKEKHVPFAIIHPKQVYKDPR